MERVPWFCFLLLMSMPAAAESVASVDASGFAAFHQLDSDRNGYVSRVEARIALGVRQVFDSADTNSDGLLDRKEYRSARPPAKSGW